MFKVLEAVVFDLDDTLYPESTFVKSGLTAVGEWCRQTLELERFAQTACQVFAEGVRGRIFNRTLELLEFTYEADLIEKMVTVYREHRPAIKLFEEVPEVLARLRESYRLGLITDGDWKTQQKKVDALQIASFFDLLVFTDRYGRACWKPAEFPYQKVMANLGCPASGCVYIGDNPHKDFITAKRLGWHTVRIRRPGAEYARLNLEPEYEAETEITTLTRLPELLGRLGNERSGSSGSND